MFFQTTRFLHSGQKQNHFLNLFITPRIETTKCPKTRFWDKTFRVLGFFFIFLFSLPVHSVLAGDVTLSWLPNDEPDLAGYSVHYGTSSGDYVTKRDAGNQTTFTLSGLGIGTYYFAVTAYDTSGNESGFSSEASKTFSETIPPSLLFISTEMITDTSAAITWTTDEPANSRVEYGISQSYGQLSPLNNAFQIGHSHTLPGLAPATTYHYRVMSTDKSGNTAVSGNFTFKTSGSSVTPDTTVPVLTNITTRDTTNVSTIIQWNTNEAATSRVEYGTSPSYGQSSDVQETLMTTHSRTLIGLLPGTTYHYRVISRDASGNLAVSDDQTFGTTNNTDNIAPVFFNIGSGTITYNSALISWGTDEAATGQVDYGKTTTLLSSSELVFPLSNSHQISLSPLEPDQTYFYRVKSFDQAGNERISQIQSFKTLLLPSNLRPPENIHSLTKRPGNKEITLEWTNPDDLNFTGVRISFRTDRFPSDIHDGSILGDFAGKPGEQRAFTHRNLKNGETYYYAAASYDDSGNFQKSILISATPATDAEQQTNTSSGGGCGMIFPNGNTPSPPGPGASAGMMTIIGILILRILKKGFNALKYPPVSEWRH